jgi:putative DNA primase/helicase
MRSQHTKQDPEKQAWRTLTEIAKALGGEVSGKSVMAPGPGHSAHDRSLSVTLSADAADGFVVHSHAGDDWRTCRDYVRSRVRLPAFEPGQRPGGAPTPAR